MLLITKYVKKKMRSGTNYSTNIYTYIKNLIRSPFLRLYIIKSRYLDCLCIVWKILNIFIVFSFVNEFGKWKIQSEGRYYVFALSSYDSFAVSHCREGTINIYNKYTMGQDWQGEANFYLWKIKSVNSLLLVADINVKVKIKTILHIMKKFTPDVH